MKKQQERRCIKCKSQVDKGQCRGCGAVLCPAKSCHLEHRAVEPKKFPAYQVLPPFCENQRKQVDEREVIAFEALAVAKNKYASLSAELIHAPDNEDVVKRLTRELQTAEKVFNERFATFRKLAQEAKVVYAGAM